MEQQPLVPINAVGLTRGLLAHAPRLLALARAVVRTPRVVLLDEVSMGLAPRVVDEIFLFLERLAKEKAVREQRDAGALLGEARALALEPA